MKESHCDKRWMDGWMDGIGKMWLLFFELKKMYY